MLLDLLTTLTEKVRAAVAAGLEPGADAAPVELGAVSDMQPDEARQKLPGSLLKAQDGSLRFVPLTHGVRVTAAGAVQIKALRHVGESQSASDVAAVNASEVALGVLSQAGKEGFAARTLTVGGVKAALYPARTNPFKDVHYWMRRRRLAAAVLALDFLRVAAWPSAVPAWLPGSAWLRG